jgi:hypothetical protein
MGLAPQTARSLQHRESADVSAGEERRIDHVPVGGEEELGAGLYGRGIAQLGVGFTAEHGVDQRFHQVARERTPASVLQADPPVAAHRSAP